MTPDPGSPRQAGATPLALAAGVAALGGALLIGCGGGGTNDTGLTTGTGITTGTNGTTTATGTTTTTGTTGTTGGPTTQGALPADRILYSDLSADGATAALRRIAADGTDSAVVAQYPSSVSVVAPNPQTPNVTAFAAKVPGDATGVYRVYRGTAAVNVATATPLATQSFASVDDIAFSPDGTIVFFVASLGGTDTPKLYRVPATPAAGNAPQVLDFVDGFFSVSPVGQRIAYSKTNATSNGTDLYVRDYSPTSTPVRLTTVVAENNLANFDRTGTKLVFSSNANGSYDLYTVPVAGGAVVQVTNTPDLNEFGAAFNDDGTSIAYSAQGQAPGVTGIYAAKADGTGARLLVPDPALNFDVYWTSKLGRARTGPSSSGMAPAGFVLHRPKTTR